VAALWTGGAPATASATSCVTVPSYPGDGAPQQAIAGWMASGATAAGLPDELPVMGGLVASGLHNLGNADTDSAGYFGIRKALWDAGPYAGFPTNPPLQLLWFTNQATADGARRAAMGIDNADPSTWGEWVADVLQPPEQFRGRYQLQLDEARALILAGCPQPPPPIPSPSQSPTPAQPPTPPDSVPPRIALGGSTRQSSDARAVTVRVRCVSEACHVDASGNARIARRQRALKLGPVSDSAAAEHTVTLRLPLPLAARRALRSGQAVRATITVTARDAADNTTTRHRLVQLGG
jgi:hypothetical protein